MIVKRGAAAGRGRHIGRRRALKWLALGTAGLAIGYRPISNWVRAGCRDTKSTAGPGWGEPLPDPNGLLDLPAGFTYRILCRSGESMDDGYRVPGSPDGTGIFAMPGGGYRLLRNHELGPDQFDRAPFDSSNKPAESLLYDPNSLGGVITIVLDSNLEVRRKFLSLAGTMRNCSGVATPWGTWLSCEETTSGPENGELFLRPHGYVFEQPASGDGLTPSVPLKALGRFSHEGAAVDPATGELYLTEDHGRGCLYKFIPDEPGVLTSGRLYALRIAGMPAVFTGNRPRKGAASPPGGGGIFFPGTSHRADWVLLEQTETEEGWLHTVAQQLGAAGFSRGEGACWANGGLAFAATDGGAERLGQIWRYEPDDNGAGGRLTLLSESADECLFNKPDNVTQQPNGDLLISEDNNRYSRLIGITPSGEAYPFAYFSYGSRDELTGIAFSPDFRFLAVSAYELGVTLLVTGPFL